MRANDDGESSALAELTLIRLVVTAISPSGAPAPSAQSHHVRYFGPIRYAQGYVNRKMR